jgi:hypothetical protein
MTLPTRDWCVGEACPKFYYYYYDNLPRNVDDKPGGQKPRGRKRPKSDTKAALKLLSHLKKQTSFFRQPEIIRFQKMSKKCPKNRLQKTAKKPQREPPY